MDKASTINQVHKTDVVPPIPLITKEETQSKPLLGPGNHNKLWVNEQKSTQDLSNLEPQPVEESESNDPLINQKQIYQKLIISKSCTYTVTKSVPTSSDQTSSVQLQSNPYLNVNPIYANIKPASSAHGIYPHLYSAIKTAGNSQCHMPSKLPLTMQISLLNLKLLTTATKHKLHMQETQSFYILNASKIESQRLQDLQKCDNWQENSINIYYDQEHSSLISKIYDWCESVEQNTTQLQTKSTTKNISTLKPQKMNPTAIQIMKNWYNQNLEHPYPNKETTESLALAGKITAEQVKKWFANTRLRTRNTKSLTEIARRRKLPLDTDCNVKHFRL